MVWFGYSFPLSIEIQAKDYLFPYPPISRKVVTGPTRSYPHPIIGQPSELLGRDESLGTDPLTIEACLGTLKPPPVGSKGGTSPGVFPGG
jgi:hypothetical protein